MPRHANKQAQSPLGHWLLDYVAKNQLSLTELSRLAGLSDGTLRSLIYYPDRLPSLETCVRLAKATGYPASSFLQLAGVVETPGADTLDPQRLDLLRLYDRLRPDLQRMLVIIAESLQKFNRPNPPSNPGE
ncbi:MAG TPA: helix-turn-helix transcriptional regulator [Anaerolineales bacterium]|nr:helix-turn-helix transcriptional regulator [Anaerolineales bacterium]